MVAALAATGHATVAACGAAMAAVVAVGVLVEDWLARPRGEGG